MCSTYFILLWSPNAQNWSKLCCNPPLLSRIGRQQLKKIYKTCLSTQTIALQSHNSLCWYFPAWQGAFTKHLALDRGCTKFCFQVVRWTTSENQFFCIDARQSWQLLINLDISLCKPGNSISDTTHAVETCGNLLQIFGSSQTVPGCDTPLARVHVPRRNQQLSPPRARCEGCRCSKLKQTFHHVYIYIFIFHRWNITPPTWKQHPLFVLPHAHDIHPRLGSDWACAIHCL